MRLLLDDYVFPHHKKVVARKMDEFRAQWFGEMSLLDSLVYVNKSQFKKLFEKIATNKLTMHLSQQQVVLFRKVFGIHELPWDKIVHQFGLSKWANLDQETQQ